MPTVSRVVPTIWKSEAFAPDSDSVPVNVPVLITTAMVPTTALLTVSLYVLFDSVTDWIVSGGGGGGGGGVIGGGGVNGGRRLPGVGWDIGGHVP